MSQEKLSIAVIICTYTEARWNDLVEAVASLKRQTYVAEEIIIVVDYNPILLKKIQTIITNVTVVENTETRGLSGARNSGIARARSSILAFLDDDAVATPDWLLLIHKACVENEIVGVGGAVIPDWQGKQPHWFPEEFLWVVGCTYRGMPQKGGSIRNPIGANMAFRRDVFQYIDGFRNGIGRIGTQPVGCEETELCIRITHYWPRKWFLYEPEASVLHKIAERRATWSYFCSRCYAEGLSKAVVAQFVGTKSGLASERTYTLKTLPQGAMRGVADSLRHNDSAGMLRAGAIVAGLFITTVGYAVGSFFAYAPKSARDSKMKTPRLRVEESYLIEEFL